MNKRFEIWEANKQGKERLFWQSDTLTEGLWMSDLRNERDYLKAVGLRHFVVDTTTGARYPVEEAETDAEEAETDAETD